MPVTGRKRLRRALAKAPKSLRQPIAEAIEDAADIVLDDMRLRVPRDQGRLAAALTAIFDMKGMRAKVGLPSAELTRRFFYARFLEEGTKGGQVRYRPRAGAGKTAIMNVPARPARPFMRPALDLNRDDIERLMRRSLARALRRLRRG